MGTSIVLSQLTIQNQYSHISLAKFQCPVFKVDLYRQVTALNQMQMIYVTSRFTPGKMFLLFNRSSPRLQAIKGWHEDQEPFQSRFSIHKILCHHSRLPVAFFVIWYLWWLIQVERKSMKSSLLLQVASRLGFDMISSCLHEPLTRFVIQASEIRSTANKRGLALRCSNFYMASNKSTLEI